MERALMGEVYTAFLPRRKACRMAIRATAVLPDPVGAIASRSSLSSTITSRQDTWMKDKVRA